MQSDELKRRISAGRGDALADLVLKNSQTQTEYIRHHRCSAAESRSGCFLIRDNKNTAGDRPEWSVSGPFAKIYLSYAGGKGSPQGADAGRSR